MNINVNAKKWWLVGGLLLTGLIQMSVPGYMIVHQEGILRDGKEYKFRTAPVDPYDMFRGRYINLNIDDARLKQDGRGYKHGETVYALLTVNPDGFAHIAGISRAVPQAGDYVAAHVLSGWEKELVLELPFSRYYLQENHAPEAEKLYRLSTNRKTAWITIKVKAGETALGGLYIDGKPVNRQLQ